MKRPSRFLAILAAACTSIATSSAVNPILNEHGVPAIWAALHGVGGALNMAEDPDGDGLTNAEEAAAGTNPFAANDVLQVKEITVVPGGLEFMFSTIAGKSYQPQSTTSLTAPTWTNAGSSHAGIDGELTVMVGDSLTVTKYFRVLVSDIDSDGDNVSDWEEEQIGLDPFSPSTDGSTPDLAAATAAAATTPVVTILASDELATEPATGNLATDLATFTIARTGGLLPITVPFTVTGPAVEGTDYATIATHSVSLGFGVLSAKVVITPMSDAIREGSEAVVLTLSSGAGYTLGASALAGILIGDYNDNTNPGGTGVTVQYRNEATSGAASPSATVDVSLLFQGPVVATQQNVPFRGEWGTGGPAAGVQSNDFTTRWTGEVMPEFSQTYVIKLTANEASRLWIDGQLLIDNFPKPPSYQPAITSGTLSATIALTAGRRYPIRVDHFEDSGSASVVLQWTAAALNNVDQDIPINRLFNQVPPQFAGSTNLLVLVSPDTYELDLAESFIGYPTSFTADNLPSGWTLNANGLISGVPSAGLAGIYSIPVSATNTHGTGSAILHLTILQTGNALTKEVWMTGAPFASLAAVPFDSVDPDSSSSVSSALSTAPNAQVNGMRLRGYITAPATGTYKFFVGGDDEAEFWLSNSDQVNDLWKRATLSTATTSGSWTGAAASDLLYLNAGLRYYFEVRSRNSGAPDGFVQIGWLKPGQTGTQPSEVVPQVNLSPYVAPPAVDTSGTLYVASLSAQGDAQTNGTGGATLQLSDDETHAIIRFNYSNLTGPLTQHHVHADPSGEIIFDMDELMGGSFIQPDGSYYWNIVPTGTFTTAASIVQVIKDGAAYLNIHTALNPAGEIRGNFAIASGSQVFNAPDAPPAAPTSAANDDEAARFLIQATYGSTTADITALRNGTFPTYESWIEDQFTKAPTYHLPDVWEHRDQAPFGSGVFNGPLTQNAWWRHSITAPDQLRQKLAYALSQTLVVSRENELDQRNDSVSDYFDMMLDNAFGNFRTLLEDVSLHPSMGAYLDMLNNDKPDITTNRIPNENYAREILQLFSIGLYRMWPDGSLILDSNNLPIPTYDQDAIIGFAHAFTGWTFDQANSGAYLPNTTTLGASAADTVLPTSPTVYNTRAWVSPMKEVPNHHFTGQKRLLNNVVLPGLTQVTVNGVPQPPPDPLVYVHSSTQIQTPEYQALASQELDQTHDQIFNNPNVGPFVCRQLIQRFVTSTPSRGYLYRVVQKFNDNGSGVRGDLKAVVKAILLDYEARSATEAARPGFGKQREPVLRVTALARAFAPQVSGFTGPYVQDGGFIKVSPTMPAHGLLTVGPAELAFTKDPGSTHNATSGTYTLFVQTSTNYGDTFNVAYNDATNDPDRSTFFTRTRDVHRGSFKQVAYNATTDVITIDTVSGHNLAAGRKVYLRFRTGTNPSSAPAGGTVIDGLYTVAAAASSTRFTINGFTTDPNTVASCVDVFNIRAEWNQQSTSRIRVEVPGIHGLQVGQQVHCSFALSNGTLVPGDGLYTIESNAASDDNSIYLTIPTGLAGSNGAFGTIFMTVAFATPADAMAVLNRTGTTAAVYSDYTFGLTDTELGQSPLYAQSVFNFYLPDYQFPGALAKSGLFTPEFQITSETQVVNVNNFLFTGFYRGTSTLFGSADWASAGLGGFRSFNGDIAIDVGPWMGPRPGGSGSTDYWTNGNATTGNLPLLFDKLNTLLTGGVVPAAAKTIILNFVANTSNISYGASPTEMNRRDRVRAIAHLIATSPDFTIQK